MNDSSPHLRIHAVRRFRLCDGPGVRTTCVLQGCPLNCWWCDEPKRQQSCLPDTRVVSPGDLVGELAGDLSMWTSTNGGVTVSGGEALIQAPAVEGLLDLLKQKGVHTAIDTSGEVDLNKVQRCLDVTDLWLWDVKALDPDHGRLNVGSAMERSWSNLRWLLGETQATVWVRVPLIRDVYDDVSRISQLGELLGSLPRLPQVYVLPGSAEAFTRWQHPGMADRIEPRPEMIHQTLEVLSELGIPTQVQTSLNH